MFSDHDSMMADFAGCVVVAGPGGCHGDQMAGWSMLLAHGNMFVVLPRTESMSDLTNTDARLRMDQRRSVSAADETPAPAPATISSRRAPATTTADFTGPAVSVQAAAGSGGIPEAAFHQQWRVDVRDRTALSDHFGVGQQGMGQHPESWLRCTDASFVTRLTPKNTAPIARGQPSIRGTICPSRKTLPPLPPIRSSGSERLG
jgi:hypothetical protein